MQTEGINAHIANEYKRLSLREQLDREVEEFLSKKGNEITELKQGETQFPDGVLPYNRSYKGERKETVAQLEKPKVVTPKPPKQPKPPEPTKKPKKPKPRKPSKPVVIKEVSADTLRRRKVHEAKLVALSNGENSFTAPCKTHGETTYLISKSDYTYCAACRAHRSDIKSLVNNNLDPKDPNALKKNLKRLSKEGARQESNRKLREQALEKGLLIFKGECKHCGVDADFKILFTMRNGTKHTHTLCIVCRRKSMRNVQKNLDRANGAQSFDEVHKNLNMTELERRNKVSEARTKAVDEGKDSFIAPCAKHGFTQFNFRSANSNGKLTSRCLECSREVTKASRAKPDSKYNLERQEREKARLERKIEVIRTPEQVKELERRRKVREDRKVAIAKGEKQFTSICAVHGQTDFRITQSKSRCILCKKAESLKYVRAKTLKEKGVDVPPALPKAEMERRKQLNEAKDAAIKQNKTRFTACCVHHGKTTFYIADGVGRCLLCKRNIQNKCQGHVGVSRHQQPATPL